MSNEYLLEALNELAAAIHSRNIRLGFYENPRPFDGMLMNVVTEVSEAQEEWRRGRGMDESYWSIKENGGEEYELSDHLRITKHDSVQYWDWEDKKWVAMTPEILRTKPDFIRHLKPEGIPSELADIIIRVLDICGYHRIDIAAAIADKMAYNETRTHRHGGKRS